MSYNPNGRSHSTGAYQGQQQPPPVPPRPPASYYYNIANNDNNTPPNSAGAPLYSGSQGQSHSQPILGRPLAHQQRPPYPVDSVYPTSVPLSQRPQQQQQQQQQQTLPQQQPYAGHQYSPSLSSTAQHLQQQQTYNPQWYASQAASPVSRFSTHSFTQPARSFTTSAVPQSYNPATYQGNNIANAANQIYGPVSAGSYTPSPPLSGGQHFASPTSSPPPSSHAFPHISQVQAQQLAHPQSPPARPQSNAESGAGFRQSQARYQSASPTSQTSLYQDSPPPPPPPRTTTFQYLEPRHRHASATNSAVAALHSSYHSTPSPNLSHADSLESDEDYSGFPPGYFDPPVSVPTYMPLSGTVLPTAQASPTHAQRASEIHERRNSQPSRPLPQPPPPEAEPDFQPTFSTVYNHEDQPDEDIDESIDEITRQMGNYRSDTDRGSTSSRQSSSPGDGQSTRLSGHEDSMPQPLFSARSGSGGGGDDQQRRNSVGYHQPNGLPRQTPAGEQSDESGEYSDDEAEAGLMAMREAEEQEAAERFRRVSSADGLRVNSLVPPDDLAPSSAISNPGVDLGLVGGGDFIHPMSYGPDPNEIRGNLGSGGSGLGAQHASTSSRSSIPQESQIPARTPSSTSYTHSSDTTSLTQPTNRDSLASTNMTDAGRLDRKLSFEEGVEREYVGLGFRSSAQRDYLSNRPLPPPPTSIDSATRINTNVSWQIDQGTPWSSSTYNPLQQGPYMAGMNSLVSSNAPPRSHSLQNHANAPAAIQPTRAKTDAEERKRQTHRLTSYGEQAVDPASTDLALDLPAIPHGRRFQPSKLVERDFDHCREPWTMSGIQSWLREMTIGESELRQQGIKEALVGLFLYKIPNMNISEAESLTQHIITSFYVERVLVREEEWLRFGEGAAVGVLPQLTGLGCYASTLHEHDGSGKCYSFSCQRTVKKLRLNTSVRQSSDWAASYGLSREDLSKFDKKEIERQNILHEIVYTEEQYVGHLDLLRVLYRENLETAQPPIIPLSKLESFVQGVFSKLDDVMHVNREFLLSPLRDRQDEEGPWIKGFSDIFRNWIRRARTFYIEYAANLPNADFLMRQEESKNSMFHTFLEKARNNPSSNRLPWSSYLGEPITRLQRYGLLLVTVQKHMGTADSKESQSLQAAIDEIKAVTMECDSRVADTKVKVNLSDLQNRLIMRPEFKHVELNLDHLGRELYYEGDLQRAGGSRFTWVDIHAILLDNYFVLAKTNPQRDAATDGPRNPRYDVSKMPIPMDLLSLESINDDPVVKSSMKGITAVSVATSKGPASPETRNQRAFSNTAMVASPLAQVASNTSLTSVESPSASAKGVPVSFPDSVKDDKIYFPFRVKHLGKETYTLYATTAEGRKAWVDKIVEAKTKHAASLFAQNAEPFRLKILADAAFAYDAWSGEKKSVTIPGTPLDRAIEEVENRYAQTVRPAPVCRTRVNCATTFLQPYGNEMVAVGTEYGVYTSELANPRGWSRVITALKVTQMAVLEEFNIFLIISDKSLIAYHLDVICPPAGELPGNDSARKAPQKLSGTRDVGFFATGRMKDRSLVFYKKREGLSATFKILEPIFQKSTEKKSRLLLHRGKTDFFREFDEFYIPTECTSIDLFSSSLAVATSKSFEILNLDKKQPWTVPDLKAQHIQHIAQRLQNMAPLAMFRLNDNEFLCVYESCGVYVNKHGDVSRSAFSSFECHAKAAALYAGYLILFDNDFVEVRDANNGRLKQIIAGKDVRCLDSGRGGQNAAGQNNRTVKFSLQHPEHERAQIVVELLLK